MDRADIISKTQMEIETRTEAFQQYLDRHHRNCESDEDSQFCFDDDCNAFDVFHDLEGDQLEGALKICIRTLRMTDMQPDQLDSLIWHLVIEKYQRHERDSDAIFDKFTKQPLEFE